MRTDTHEEPRSYYRGCKVFLNGVEMSDYSTMADDITGEIRVCAMADGEIAISEDGKSVREVILKGNVEIIPPPNGWGAG